MKKIEWINGNKMKFESLHKTFNNYVTAISTGNVFGGGQTSGFIRGYTDEGEGLVDYPENKRPKGDLQEWDLNNFVGKVLPNYVKEYVRKVAINNSIIAYSFFYYKNDKRYSIGYVITDNNHKLLKAFYERSFKSQDALNECIKYITEWGELIWIS